jgi:acetyltransferase-like isoleucine patch superfamily enzyme
MKALNTVGVAAALRFLWYTQYAWLLHVSLPPVRVWLLRLAGARIGADNVLMDVHFINMYHYGFRKLTIGKNCFIGDEAMIDLRGGVSIGDNVTISNRTTIVTHINVGYADHPLQKAYPKKESRVTLRSGAYVGTNATILPGITVGLESVVGAGAVVTKNVADHTVVVGVPAKILKKLQ